MSGSDADDRDRVTELAALLHGHLLAEPGNPDAARVARIAREASRAFHLLHDVRRGVALFGSARPGPVATWGARAGELSRLLVAEGFAVITGGGPGLMAAANEGARIPGNSAGARSIGLTIDLPEQELANDHLDLQVPFHYFFLRKLAFVKYTCAFVCLPGGYGTLDELFEALNLVRTHRLDPFPVMLFGADYWTGLVDWLRSTAVEAGCLDRDDLALMEVVDEPAAVVERVTECHRTLCRRLGIAG